MRLESLSLRARLSGTIALLFLCGTVALYLAARAYGRAAADRSYDRLLAGSALSIAETLSIERGEVRVDVPYAALDMLSAAPDDRIFYRISGPDSSTITGYGDLPTPPAALTPGGSGTEASGPEAVQFFEAPYTGEQVRFAVLRRRIAEPGVTGWILVQVGQTRRARQALADELALTALAPIGLLTLLAFVAVAIGVRRSLRPLERVGADLSTREPADLRPVATPVPADMAPLVDALNGFMRRLEANISALRSFIAEAAHQMRTPLAALRAQAQVALDEEDPAEQRARLIAVERNASRLTRLLNQLLSDATVTHRSDVRRFEHFDLLQVVGRALQDVVPMAGGVGEVHFQADLEEAPMTGDAIMIGEAVKNLVDNALRHGGGPAHGPIDVELTATADGSLALNVCDRGPGIPAGERERVFERFARGSDAAAGAGLGLAIARHVARSHGGDIHLADRKGGGLCVELRIPRGAA
jgi:two-component system sensor histidine kinase TctE